jgi:Na+/melibiose symporter-like transporter
MNGIYNVYVPVYLQAGNPAFSTGTALTLGFGLGAGLVGLWMTLDNILGFILQPIIGAWSDRTRSRWGRRLPFVLATLPLVTIGFVLIPLAPRLIPPELNGQMVGMFALFTFSCALFNLGYIPQRSILQTLRQETLAVEDRPKIETWNSVTYTLTLILAYTAGSMLYRLYAPALFWVLALMYTVAILVFLFCFRESPQLAQAAENQQNSIFAQLKAVFANQDRRAASNFIFFLLSVFFITVATSAAGNFVTSWIVNILNLDESRASQLLAIYTITAMLASLPAGYWAAKKWGHRRTYASGIFIIFIAFVMMALYPALYVLALAVFGIGVGAVLVTQLPLATELNQRQDNLGAAVGVFNFAYMFAFVIGANIVGWIIQMTSYNALFYAASISALMGFIAIFMVRDTHTA